MNKYKLILLAFSMTGFVQAKVILPAFFTDNMVVQQNSTLTLPGKAKAGKNVTVKPAGMTISSRQKQLLTVLSE